MIFCATVDDVCLQGFSSEEHRPNQETSLPYRSSVVCIAATNGEAPESVEVEPVAARSVHRRRSLKSRTQSRHPQPQFDGLRRRYEHVAA